MTVQAGWFSPKPLLLASASLVLLQLGGCGFLKNRFPERGPESEYMTATTLPPLEVPPDLLAGQAGRAVTVPGLDESQEGVTRYSTFAEGGSDSQPVPLAEKPAFARMARSETGTGLLQVQEPFNAAWGHVAEGLEAANIDIKGSERDLGYYEVAYEPVNPPEKSLLSKINLFSSDKVNYRIVLSDKVEWTAITVRDAEGARDSTDTAYEMLTLLGQNYPVEQAQTDLSQP